MTKISLRGYNREIEALIDRGKNDEAIAHGKFILKSFPKHIDTYRLLGKAYLESQSYTESADIFQRVLSVIPDDFVSQIGLSIIREDEGNLDAAIWHIERAFEVQPSNAAIQEEIRRLYGRRDGIQLTKMRLTRGALIRMYLHGELFPQAIAETRAALTEDPNRLDLETILARLYYLSGKKIEATETCSNIIKKLPYCYEANKILAVILQGTERAKDAKIFQHRILSIEPYAAQVSKNAPTINQVPDNAITLERMEWEPSEVDTDQPEWARTVGVEFEKETHDELPEWIPATSAVLPPTADAHQEKTHFVEEIHVDKESVDLLEPADSKDIPDWMKTAGWEKSIKDSETQPEDVFDLGEEDAVPADVPEWLRSIAPEIDPHEEEDILKEVSPEETPVWLQELEAPDEDITEPILPSAEEIPGVIGETTVTEPIQEEVVEDKVPLSQEDESDEVITWLESLAESQGAEQNTLISSPEKRIEEPPEWIKKQLDTEQIEQPVEEVGPSPEEYQEESDEFTTVTPGISELVETASEIGEAEVSEQEHLMPEQPPEDQMAEVIPGLLKDLELDEEPVMDAISEVDESTGWLQAETLGEDQTLEAEDAAELHEEPSNQSASPPPDDIEEALAWLESNAEKQGVDQETLFTSPEDHLATPSEWFKDQISEVEPHTVDEQELLPEAPEFLSSEAPEKTEVIGPPVPVDFASEEQEVEIPSVADPEREAETLELGQDLKGSIDWLESLAEDIEPGEDVLITEEEPRPEPSELIFEEQEISEDSSTDEQEVALEEQSEVYKMDVQEELAEEIEIIPEQVGDDEISGIDAEVEPVAQVTEAQETIPSAPNLAREFAFQTLISGNKNDALEQYEGLIQEGELIGEVIDDLKKSLDQYPIDVDIWQILGDAYTKSNRLQDALDAYTKAEEFLR